MASNKSNAMAVICVFSIFFTLINAPGNAADEHNVANLVVGSPAHHCYNGLKYFCAVSSSRIVYKEECLFEAIRGYPRNPNPPDFVETYFGMFSSHVDPSTCHLPAQYCQIEANDSFTDRAIPVEIVDQLCAERKQDCINHLKIFNDLVETPEEELNDVQEMEQKSRYNILNYLIYDIIAIESNNFMIDHYSEHIADCAKVSSAMPEPISFCMLNYSNTVSQE